MKLETLKELKKTENKKILKFCKSERLQFNSQDLCILDMRNFYQNYEIYENYQNCLDWDREENKTERKGRT